MTRIFSKANKRFYIYLSNPNSKKNHSKYYNHERIFKAKVKELLKKRIHFKFEDRLKGIRYVGINGKLRRII